MTAFRFLPSPLRRLAVHAGTPSYTVGAVLVLRRADGHVLMVDQRHSAGWALPGGLLRRGETPAEALVREVAEEVGLRFEPDRLPVPLTAVDPRARRVDLVYVVDSEGDPDPHREDEAEVRRIGWFPLDELPDVGDPTLDIFRAVRLT
jgi:ADP-ribose pyrophosphatase YjhB (NUDIX family)